jgi:hypothetical protein
MPGSTALDPDSLEIDERASILWRNNRALAVELTQLALSTNDTTLRRSFVAGIARSIDSDGVVAVTAGRPELIQFFCRHNRKLLRTPELWGLGREIARALWDVVRQQELDEISPTFLRAILQSGAEGLEDEILAHFGAEAVREVMGWIGGDGKGQPRTVTDAWQRALRRDAPAVLSWLSSTPSPTANSLVLVSAVVDPGDERTWGVVAPEVWLRLAQQVSPQPIEFMALVLAIGFRIGGEQGGALIAEAFEAVHEAARRSALPYTAWTLVERYVPRIYAEWDRCERLRRALAEGTIGTRWPITTLFRAARDPRIFEPVIEYCRYDADRGRRFIKGLMKGEPSDLDATPEQVTILKRYS